MDTNGPYAIIRLTAKERPVDRFLSLQSPALTIGRQEITAVLLTEIENRWHPAREIGEAISPTFMRAFQKSQNKSILTKFEDALKTVNHFLELNEEKLAEPVNCAIALLVNDEIYFSAINNATIFLIRGNRLSEVTQLEKNTKKFSSVTNGELNQTDTLIFSSHQLAAKLKTIRSEVWQSKPRKTVITELAEELDATERPLSVGLFVEYTPNAASDETIYLDEAESRLPLRLPQIKGRLNVSLLSRPFFAFFAFIKKLFTRIFRRRVPAPSSTNLPLWKKLRGYLPLVIFIVLVTVGLRLIQNRIYQANNEATISIPTINTLINAVSAEDTANFLLANLTENNYQTLSDSEKAAFKQTVNSRGLELLTPEIQVAELGANVVAADSSDKKLYLIDSNGQLWQYETSLAKIEQKSLITEPTGLVVMAEDRILVNDKAGAVWLFDTTKDQPINLALPDKITKGPKLLQSYQKNLYIMDPENHVVWKISHYLRDIINPTTAAKTQDLGLAPTMSWVVNGQFIAADAAGQIKDFRNTQLGKVSISYYPSDSPIRLSLGGSENDLYVARAKLITSYALSTNSPVKKWALVSSEPISALNYGPNQKIWLTAGKKIYQLAP